MRDDARFLTLLFVRAPRPDNKVHQTLLMDEFFSFKQIQLWTTDLFHSVKKYTHKLSAKQYMKSSEKQESAKNAA